MCEPLTKNIRLKNWIFLKMAVNVEMVAIFLEDHLGPVDLNWISR